MIPTGGIGILQHILYLFPTSLSAPALFWSYMSYPVGGFATDVTGAIAMLYLSLVVVCVPLAAVSLQAASGGVATSAKQAETFCQRAARTRRAAPRNAHPARRHPAASAALPLPRAAIPPMFAVRAAPLRPPPAFDETPMWRIVRPAIQRGSSFGAANRIVSVGRRKRTSHAD